VGESILNEPNVAVRSGRVETQVLNWSKSATDRHAMHRGRKWKDSNVHSVVTLYLVSALWVVREGILVVISNEWDQRGDLRMLTQNQTTESRTEASSESSNPFRVLSYPSFRIPLISPSEKRVVASLTPLFLTRLLSTLPFHLPGASDYLPFPEHPRLIYSIVHIDPTN
jgi:hypothetical protein